MADKYEAIQMASDIRRRIETGHNGVYADVLTEAAVIVDAVREDVERIMTNHSDIAACDCDMCSIARNLGLRPRTKYMPSGLKGSGDG